MIGQRLKNIPPNSNVPIAMKICDRFVSYSYGLFTHSVCPISPSGIDTDTNVAHHKPARDVCARLSTDANTVRREIRRYRAAGAHMIIICTMAPR